MSYSIEILGLMAAGCTTFAFIPQVLKVFKTRSVGDISILMYCVFCSGVLMWLIYGLYLQSIPIILANVVTLGLALAILIMKILWNKEH